MLQLPVVFTEDPHAEDLIRSYLTDRILDLVDEVIDNYVMDNDMEELFGEDYDYAWLLNDPEFTEEICDFFPEDFPEEDMASAYFGLKEDLEAEEERALSPAMEYVVCRLIMEEIILMSDETLLPMEGREYVYHVLRQEEEKDRREGMAVYDFDEELCDFAWTEELRKARDEGRAVPSAFYILNHLEDIRFYPSLLFKMDEGKMTELAEEFLRDLLAEMEMADEEEDWEEEEDYEGDEDDILPFDLTWNRKSYLHGSGDGDDDFLPF
jgi:hypothetical protein